MIRQLILFLLTCVRLSAAESVLSQSDPLPADQTRCWSPGMNFCWHQLRNNHSISIVKPDPDGKIKELDKRRFEPKNILPKGSYFLFSGPATKETEDLINQELKSRWPADAEHVEVPEARPGSIFSFAYFNHQFRYYKRFYRSKKIGLPFKIGGESKDVAFFGIKGESTAEYPVKMLNYEGMGEAYALEIPGLKDEQSLVLMMDSKITNFESALKKLADLRKNYQFLPTTTNKQKYHRLHEEDDLRIPFVDFRSETDFQPQLSKVILAKAGSEMPWRIFRAREKTRFTMDELGAKVVVQADIMAGPFGEPPEEPIPYPRKFYFDRPFYVSLWMSDAEAPYFIARIASYRDLELFAIEP